MLEEDIIMQEAKMEFTRYSDILLIAVQKLMIQWLLTIK